MRWTEYFKIGLAIGVVIIVLLESLGWAQPMKADPTLRVALVNGEAITLGDVDTMLAQRPVPLNVPTAGQIRQMRMEILAPLVDEMLLKQFMRDHGPKVDASRIDEEISNLQKSLKSQNRTLADYLREQNQTEAQLRASMLLLLQLDRHVKEHTTDADMRKYYETNKDYFDKNRVRTSHIVLRLPSDASPAEREKAKLKLQAIRNEIVSGKLEFAKAAKDHSQCPSAPKGGDIDFIARKFQNVDEAFAKAAFALKVGDISDVVETEFGVHLIKVTDRVNGKPTQYEQAIEDVRDCYAEDLRVALLNQLRKKAKVEVTLP